MGVVMAESDDARLAFRLSRGATARVEASRESGAVREVTRYGQSV
jgi:hypothetical protein